VSAGFWRASGLLAAVGFGPGAACGRIDGAFLFLDSDVRKHAGKKLAVKLSAPIKATAEEAGYGTLRLEQGGGDSDQPC
jgi:hypothetical protein